MNRHARRKNKALGKTAVAAVRLSAARFGEVKTLGAQAGAALKAQLAAFRAKFGRDPAPADPLFFDPEAPGPRPVAMNEQRVRERMADELRRAGSREHIVRAFVKTGRMVTQEVAAGLTASELDEWRVTVRACIAEIKREFGYYDPETGATSPLPEGKAP